MAEKIRSYTNSENEVIEVTKDHLDTAIELKIELQKLSPSLRCDWKKHRQMMEEEGYYDSDSNESYRCLVKEYQGKMGLLSSMGKHVDMVATSKLESLNRMLGSLYSEKRENQLTLQEINRFRREFHLSKVVAEEIIGTFKGFKLNVPKYTTAARVTKLSSNKALVVLTDLHVGAIVEDVYGNNYNFKIANQRMKAYLLKVVDYCKRFQVTDVVVAGLGDFIEHLYMRSKQSREAEFGLAKQILKASELVIEFIVSLSEHVNVEYSGIAGNHDRLQGDKDINFDDDNANVIINYNIQTAIQFINSPRITYVAMPDGATEMNKEINGKKIKLVHGHLDNSNKKDRIKGYISMQNEFFDCLVYGHLHHFHLQESDNGRLAIGVGSLEGRNDYSKNFNAATNASQMIMIVTGEGDMLPIRVDLQNA